MTPDYSFTQHRILQWMGILLALGIIAVSYWYFGARAGVKINTSEVQSGGSGRLESGLGLYYAFDEGTGSTVNDLSSNIYDGTTNVTWTAGRIEGAGYFDGSANVSDSDSAPEAIDFIDGEDFTMAGWFNRDTFTSDDTIIARRGGTSAANNGYILYIDDATDKLTFEVSDGTDEYQLESASTFTSTGWHHFTLTWDDAVGAIMYVDGLAEAATATGTFSNIGSISTGSGLRVGSNSVASMYYNGWIDEIRVYTWNLSAEDVTNLSQLTSASSPDENLDGYWSFNAPDIDGSSAYDMSGVNNTGTLTNGPTVTQGKVGQALDFDGTDDYVTITDVNDKLDMPDGQDFTLMIWFNRDTFTTEDSLLGKRAATAAASAGYLTYIDDATDKVTFEVSDGTDEYQLESTDTFTSAGWHHMAVVFDDDNATNCEIYINGVANSATKTGTLGNVGVLSQSAAITIGFNTSASNYFDGKLDEPRIYKRALSGGEIKALYDQGQADATNTGKSQAQGTGRLDSGLAGYWKLDDGSGTSATDSSTNGNTGTLPVAPGGPTWTTGQIGGAVNFDGSDDYITVPNSNPLDVVDGEDFTLSGWFNRDTFTSDHTIIAKRGSLAAGNNGYALYIPGTGDKLTLEVADGTDEYLIESTSTFTAAGWYHFSLVWNDASASETKLYINGVAEAATTTGTFGNIGTMGNTKAFTLGMLSDGGSYFDGKLDEIRFYDRTLSAEEVSQLYRLTSPTGVDTGLKGYWSFNGQDMNGTTAYDRSGAGNAGTLTNGPTKVTGKVGQALSLDGSDDYATVADASALDITGAISMGVWIKTSDTDSCIMSKTVASTAKCFESAGNKVYELGVLSSTLYFQTSNGTTANVVSGSATSLLDNQWHYVVATWDGTTTSNGMKIYIDGAALYQGTATVSTIQSTSSALTFGGDSGSYDYAGLLDEGRLYNRALSAAEIKSLYDQGQSDKTNSSISQSQGTGRLDSGLAAYWKFDDASGTSATDSSPNSNTGTLTNFSLNPWTTGQIEGGLNFDGSDDVVLVTDANSLDMVGAMTFSAWIKADTYVGAGSYRSIVSKGSFGIPSVNYSIRLYGAGTSDQRIIFAYYAGGAQVVQGVTNITTGSWKHIGVMYDDVANDIKLYIDGAEEAFTVTSGDPENNSLSANTANIEIGRYNGNDQYFDGPLDEIRLYSRALSSNEMLQLYRLTSPTGTDTGLKGYWSFNGQDMSSTTAYDRSGAGNNGTLTGGPTKAIGKIGQALNFDGSDDYVTVADASSLDSTSALTISVWIKADNWTGESGYATLVKKDGNYVLRKDTASGSTLRMYWWDGSNIRYVAVTTLPTTGEWHHIVGVVTGNDVSAVYVDGVSSAGTAATFLVSSRVLTNVLEIGSGASGTESFDGSIDEVRIYNTALTAAQIQTLYNQGR